MSRYTLLLALALAACSAPAEDSTEIKRDAPDETFLHVKQRKNADGEVISEVHFYPDGQKKMEGPVLEGEKHGTWIAWFQGGGIWSEHNYAHGIQEGIVRVYYNHGNLRYEGEMKAGKRSGLWVFYDKAGSSVKEISYE